MNQGADGQAGALDGAIEETADELYELAPCGLLSTLPDGTIARVNQTLLDWTGYRRDDLVGRKRFQDLLTLPGKVFHDTHYGPLLQMQGSVREIALDLVCVDRGPLPILVNARLSRAADGTPLAIRTAIFTATERRKYERELLFAKRMAEQGAKAKSDLLAVLGHEIRTPLTALGSALQLLERTTALSPQQERYVRILDSSVGRLFELINDILDFSKIEAGRMTLDERKFDLRELLQGIAQTFAAKAEEKGIAVRVEIDEQVPAALLGDRIKIGQVITNFVGNAVKFTERGAVTLACRMVDAAPDAVTVDLSVADTGIGIAPDRLEHIFEEYAQASSDIGLKYGGTGLGLAISRRLVQLHGSKVAVESSPAGSKFSFALKLRVAEQT